MDISNRVTPIGFMKNDGSDDWSDNMLKKSMTVILRDGVISLNLPANYYRWSFDYDDTDIIFFTTYKKEHDDKDIEWFWRDDEVKVAEPNEFDFKNRAVDDLKATLRESFTSALVDDTSGTEFSKNQYYTNDGEDYLDNFIKNHSPTEVRAAFKFTIGKYLSRLGKKDGIVEESYKIADYAQRFHNFELSLLNDD